MKTQISLFTLAAISLLATGCTLFSEPEPEVAPVETEVQEEITEDNSDTTETGIADSIEEGGEPFDVAEELKEVYEANQEPVAVTGNEESKHYGFDASNLTPPGTDDSQIEAGIDPDTLIDNETDSADVVNEPVETVEPVQEEGSTEEVSEPVAPPAAPGVYKDYSASAVSEGAANGDVVLFFHASWCPTCRTLDSAISGSDIPEGVTILKVNYEDALELRQQHGVTYQHTLVKVDGSGNQLSKWSGGSSLQSILNNL